MAEEEPEAPKHEEPEEDPEPEMEEPEAEASHEISLDLDDLPRTAPAPRTNGGDVAMTVETAEPEMAAPEPAAEPAFEVEAREDRRAYHRHGRAECQQGQDREHAAQLRH